jgi:Ca2+-binding EF-hand superfamily protein
MKMLLCAMAVLSTVLVWSESASADQPATGQNDRAGLAQGVTADQAVNIILKRFDTNHDGKISREEAKGPLAKNFDKIDTNHDGYLDRKELQAFLAKRPGAQQGKGKADSQARQPAKPTIPDFDALDSDADGRLSRQELAGTPLAEAFDEMDTNKDGKIDRKEFEAYFQKQADKKAAADKK